MSREHYRTISVLAVFLLGLLIMGGCGTSTPSFQQEPSNLAQYQAFQQQLEIWRPFINSLNYVMTFPQSGQPDREALSAVRAVVQAPIRYFSARAGSNFNLSDSQLRYLNQLNSFSVSLRKRYRNLLLENLSTDSDANKNKSFRHDLERANQQAKQFITAWEKLRARKNFIDSPRDFNWYMDK